MVRLQVLHVHGPPTRVGARGRRNPGQLVELELVVEVLVEELVEELLVLLELVVEELVVLVELDLVGEQDEQRT